MQCGTYAVGRSSYVDFSFVIALFRSVTQMVSKLFVRQGPGPLPPPPSPEYLNENLAPRMLAVDGTLFGLALLCVVLRVYVRAFMLKTLGIDGESASAGACHVLTDHF